MPKHYKMSDSKFFCTQCGKEGVPIFRKKGQERKSGHLKKLYCLFCKEEVNHVEVRFAGDYSKEDFEEEFAMGRFIDGNRVPMDELFGCTNNKCPFNKDGKCWNANRSARCGHKPMEVE